MRNSMLLPLALCMTLLNGCATQVVTDCPPVKPFPTGLADRIETLTETDPLFLALADYETLRSQVLLCRR